MSFERVSINFLAHKARIESEEQLATAQKLGKINSLYQDFESEEQEYLTFCEFLCEKGIDSDAQPELFSVIAETYTNLQIHEQNELSTGLYYGANINNSAYGSASFLLGMMLSRIDNNNQRQIALQALASFIPSLKETIRILGDLDKCVHEAEFIQNNLQEIAYLEYLYTQ